MSTEEASPEEDAGSSLLLNQPVVIDNGTSTLKAGFAGSSKPKVSFDLRDPPAVFSEGANRIVSQRRSLAIATECQWKIHGPMYSC